MPTIKLRNDDVSSITIGTTVIGASQTYEFTLTDIVDGYSTITDFDQYVTLSQAATAGTLVVLEDDVDQTAQQSSDLLGEYFADFNTIIRLIRTYSDNQIRNTSDVTGDNVAEALNNLLAGGGSGLTAPANPAEDGYVAIASGGDLTYIDGPDDGYVLTWNDAASTWEGAAPKRDMSVMFVLSEDVNNTTAYFFTWNSVTANGIRSSAVNGMQNPNSCNPFQVPWDATITRALLSVKGVGVQNGSVTYPVSYETDLIDVDFSTETKITDVDFDIPSGFPVGTFSVGSTNFKGGTDLNIDVDEGDTLGMQFRPGSSASIAGQTRMAFITLVLEER